MELSRTQSAITLLELPAVPGLGEVQLPLETSREMESWIWWLQRSGVNLLFGNGDGTFQGAVVVGSGSNGEAAADINGDGKLDIVSAALTSSGGLIVSSAMATAHFRPR